MGYINSFGFEIYRLRKAKPENEFLLFDKENNIYNTYSKQRCFEFLELEFKIKGIDLTKYVQDILKIEKNINYKKMLKAWFEEEVITIDNIGFRPSEEKIFVYEEETLFNTFKAPKAFNKEKYKLEAPMSFEELKEKAPYTTDLLLNIHGYNEAGCRDTLLKIADRIKFPYEKGQDCIIFYPAERAGKGIFYKYILVPIFEKYARKLLMKRLSSDFNDYLREPLVLVLEEGKRDIELVETLKDMVTESTLLINGKGKPQEELPVYFLSFVFSNHMNPIDLGKSRGSYYICRSLGRTYEESQKKGAKICEEIPKEIDYLIYYLHNLEFEHQEALMPFNTKAKESVNELNKSPLELFYDSLLHFPTIESSIFYYHKKRFGDGIALDLKEFKDVIYISKDIIRSTYNNFCHLEGFRSNLISHNKDLAQLWALLDIADYTPKRLKSEDGRKIDYMNLLLINQHLKLKYQEEEEE